MNWKDLRGILQNKVLMVLQQRVDFLVDSSSIEAHFDTSPENLRLMLNHNRLDHLWLGWIGSGRQYQHRLCPRRPRVDL